MNAVVYARYSSHKQGEQSIEGQLASAYKYAGEHGYTIIHEYIDRAQTGRNDDREQFQQMLKDTAKHQFEAIIIGKIDRFAAPPLQIATAVLGCDLGLGADLEGVLETVYSFQKGGQP